MSEPFLAEIRIMGFSFAPRGWAKCDGQILPINQNQSLYSLLGTIYGGDGRTSFALPDLRSRAPIHRGSPATGGTFAPVLGQKTGEETHTLSAAEMPAHTHNLRATSEVRTADNPAEAVYAKLTNTPFYEDPSGKTTTTLNPATVTNTGGSQAHNNMQPFAVLNFCIAMQGLFPSRN